MRQPIPIKAIAVLLVLVGVVGLVVGLVSDLGATGPWIAGAVGVGIASGLVAATSNGPTDVLLAEALLVVAVGLAAFFGYSSLTQPDTSEAETGRVTSTTTPRGVVFRVAEGESDPDPGSYSYDTDSAYPRIAPQPDAPAAEEPPVSVGEKVLVMCRVVEVAAAADSNTWYRLQDDSFLSSELIQRVPHKGREPVPACP